MNDCKITELYPRPYATDGTRLSNLRFALNHEPFDIGVLVAALEAIGPRELEAWVRAEPTGTFSRRAWFLYETFTGRTLDVENVRTGNYVSALDPKKHIIANRRNSPRHRVVDNLLGGPDLCPIVRRTPRLARQLGLGIDDEARALVSGYDPAMLARAVHYLYTKETRSSYAIEGERPSAKRAERFIAALRAAPVFDPSNESALIRLQGEIVDPRYAASGWRDFQNFVGATVGGYREEVHFICPRPQDLPRLINGWKALTERVVNEDVDPVIAAAVSAFAFVILHPFEDGNGRIHRFLIHHVLAKRGYSPPGVIFPISAAIMRDRQSYDDVLETFSRPLFEFIAWRWTRDREVVVDNDTTHLYRFFDATAFAEYLHDQVVETVRRDLKQELGFIVTFDRALEGVREIVDMPDRRAALFVRLCMQNGGRLSRAKRQQFPELSDAEIAMLEAAVSNAMKAEASEHPQA